MPAGWSKQYELLHDIHKITPPNHVNYDDTQVTGSILHTPRFELGQAPVFPGGYYPPQGQMMLRLNQAFGNPWHRPQTWGRDGRIEQGLSARGNAGDQAIVLCMILFLLAVAGLCYMAGRLVRKGWARLRRGRAVPEGPPKDVHAWSRWIEAVCIKRSGLKAHSGYDWDRFAGKKRMHSFPV